MSANVQGVGTAKSEQHRTAGPPFPALTNSLAPHYEEAATELKSKNIKLAKVDCTEQAELCGEYGVTGYPTLKVFRNGEPTDYSGPRKADGIISYMIK